jgi:two-component system, OmpR family, sensor kinase
VLYAAGVATAGMALFSVLLSGLASGGVQTDQDQVLAVLATDAASAMAESDPPGLGLGRPLVVADLAIDTDPFVIVTGEDGTVQYTTAELGGEPPRIPAAVIVEALDAGHSEATIHPTSDVELRVAAKSWDRGAERGVAIAGQSTRVVTQQLAGLRFFLTFSAIVTIIVVVIVSWLVLGRAMRPLRTLTAAADEIGRTGDLGSRLPPAKGRDEVAVLTRSFNEMLDRLEGARRQLAETLAAQRRFVADASHELRTPLTTIRNNAEFVRENPDAAAADRAEAIADIAAESERMSRLVDGLLWLARVDAGQPIERRPVDLGAIAADVARKARRPDRAVRFEDAGPAIVLGDGDALARLTWTLVDNALRHGDGEVVVIAGQDAGSATLRVQDRGRGIPPGDEERIFDRFYRADAARSGEGTGLGLAIARSIAEAHGGSISATNGDGGGAVFEVSLPIALDGTPG